MQNITLDSLFIIFFVAIIVDFVTGVIAAAREGRLKSRTCSDGMFRSIGECIVLICAMFLAYIIPNDVSVEFLGVTITFVMLVGVFMIGFIFKEGLSICENLKRMGVWIPNSIKNSLEAGINKIDKGEM